MRWRGDGCGVWFVVEFFCNDFFNKQRFALYQLSRAPRGWDGGLRHEKGSEGSVILVVRRELRGDLPWLEIKFKLCCGFLHRKTKYWVLQI